MKPYFQRGIALGALLALVVGGGCKVGSDYQKPNASAQLNESFAQTEADKVQEQVGADVSSWWSQINDETLAQLTNEAVSGNLTLREAMFRIQAARAALGSTNANLLPQVAQDGSYTHQTAQGHSQSVFATATSMAWEIDVFGRIQRSIEAAEADMEVQRELYRDAYVILIGDVAQAYVDARACQDQIRVAKINILVQEYIVDYVRIHREAGSMSALDEYRALGPLHNTRATLVALETQYQQTLNQLSILVGRPPGRVDEMMADTRPIPAREELREYLTSDDLTQLERFVEKMGELLLEDLLVPETPDQILVGIPADLLRRRPDIRAAEQRIIAQNARVGVAVADLYPMFTLSGSFGLQANSFSNMFDSDSIVAGVGPAFRWNILNFGKYRFNIEAQRFMQEELIATYRQTVLKAAEEVDNALVTYVNESGRNATLAQAVDAYLKALHKTLEQRQGGIADIQPILEAEAGLLTNGLQFIQSKANATGSVVQLYRALGGDWYTNASSAPTGPAAAAVANRDASSREADEREARLDEREARLAEREARLNERRASNADFRVATVDDDELEASPELAEPVLSTVEDGYADEALLDGSLLAE